MSKASDNVFPRFLISEGGSTATPAANRVTVYAKANGLLYSKDDAGAETALGGGSGSVATDAIWDAAGDLAVGTGVDTAARLARGTALQVLRVNSGATTVEWAAAAAAAFVGCSAWNSAAQSVNNTTWTILTFDSENFDTSAIHSTGANTGRMTIPSGMGGYWRFTAYVQFAGNTTGLRAIDLYKNGVSVGPMVRVGSPPTTNDVFTLTLNSVLSLVATDYIELYAYQASGGALNVGNASQPQGTLYIAQYLGA